MSNIRFDEQTMDMYGLHVREFEFARVELGGSCDSEIAGFSGYVRCMLWMDGIYKQ